jgi:hypothetical protein
MLCEASQSPVDGLRELYYLPIALLADCSIAVNCCLKLIHVKQHLQSCLYTRSAALAHTHCLHKPILTITNNH